MVTKSLGVVNPYLDYFRIKPDELIKRLVQA